MILNSGIRSDLDIDSSGVTSTYDALAPVERVFGIRDFAQCRPERGAKVIKNARQFEEAHNRESNNLLNRAGCQKGSRFMEAGCGYARPLRIAVERGAIGTGITISHHQVKRGIENGLDVRFLNYRDMSRVFPLEFDCILANGPIEHFQQPENVLRGEGNAIYREMFEIFRDASKPGSRLVTTCCHSRRYVSNPEFIIHGKHRRRSPESRMQSLTRNFPGWYPFPSQFETCARGLYRLVHEEDGCEDYRMTSEYWNRAFLRKLYTNPVALSIFIKSYIRRDKFWNLIDCFVIEQAWPWQFRPGPNGELSPMTLYRHVWERVD